jgi:A/G-specific adenine glycosylase
MLGGMAALPGGDWTEAPQPRSGELGTVRHVFTHFSLDLAIVPRAEPLGEGWWHPVAGLAEAGLPTLYRRAAELALGATERLRAAA